MHLKFLRCQQMFCCFSVKNMDCKPTLCLLFVKLYMELVYPIIDYCSLCSSGAATSKSHWLFNLHLQKSQPGEFPHLSLIANICSMHHAGPSSSTLYPSINLN